MGGSIRILVVEDEAPLAEMLLALLQEEGFEVAGPAGTVNRAMDVIESSRVDAAILDIRLFDELSYPVAYALGDRGIPFMFLTSHRRADLPTDLRCRPLIEKPFHAPELFRTMRGLLSAARAPAT